MANPYTCIYNIRVGGVFSGEIDIEKFKKETKKLIKKNDLRFSLDNCMSRELTGNKVSYITIAGGWSYVNYDNCRQLAIDINKKFDMDIFFIFFDEINGVPRYEHFDPYHGTNGIVSAIARSC